MSRTQHPNPETLCCESMQAALEMNCDTHDDPFECPDSLVAYNEAFNQFALIVHDGGARRGGDPSLSMVRQGVQ